MAAKKAGKASSKDKSSKGAKLSKKEYEVEIEKLHVELVKLQYWVKEKGLKVIVLLEGRDAAGKGGVIKRITERVSPRVFRVVALPAPSSARRPSSTCSGISPSSRQPAKSCCLTEAGTTARGSSG